ncbi:hypothetical protein [Burkholderia glumae]|uniref:FH2 domain-containing protein n=1 Tax=Burkholderia glumae TaxID=337 RepID=A0ABY5BHB9_BURGL|nr:hypothetical protein [Burkholderia glumae]QKM55014.1 hypothetical protein CG017_03064 [Burkholderia glumae]USS44961.1 hypothetical protein NFI99_25510 [Burkholderia glumae]
MDQLLAQRTIQLNVHNHVFNLLLCVGNIVNKRSPDADIENLNVTTEATLVALAEQITGFVAAGTLDSRCAAKFVKRLKKEGEVVAEGKNSTASGRKSLKKALDALDVVLREHDAKLLVEANAALRAKDTA